MVILVFPVLLINLLQNYSQQSLLKIDNPLLPPETASSEDDNDFVTAKGKPNRHNTVYISFSRAEYYHSCTTSSTKCLTLFGKIFPLT